MAKITRKTLTLFGNAGASTNFGKFGSKAAAAPVTSQDPDVIQSLAAWSQGWQDAVVSGNKAAYMEDMNGWCYVHSYMLAYVLQQGIPEWDASTTYYENSVVQTNDGQWFNSLQDNNTGNAPPVGASNALWEWINSPPVVPQAVAVGTIIDHAGGTPPTGYLACDGSAVSRTTYAALFAQIGVIWGIGDGVTTFNVPNMNRRVGVGSGGSGTGTLGATVGSVGGAETHTLTIPEIPAHTHTYVAPSTADGAASGGFPFARTPAGQTSGSVGGDGAHNNMQPSAVVLKLIKT